MANKVQRINPNKPEESKNNNKNAQKNRLRLSTPVLIAICILLLLLLSIGGYGLSRLRRIQKEKDANQMAEAIGDFLYDNQEILGISRDRIEEMLPDIIDETYGMDVASMTDEQLKDLANALTPMFDTSTTGMSYEDVNNLITEMLEKLKLEQIQNDKEKQAEIERLQKEIQTLEHSNDILKDKITTTKGEKGETGATGAAGSTGATGATGQSGSAGSNGRDGKNGLDGREGRNGLDGRKGEDGYATYVLFSANADGLNPTDDPVPGETMYIGVCTTQGSKPYNPSMYTWSQYVGQSTYIMYSEFDGGVDEGGNLVWTPEPVSGVTRYLGVCSTDLPSQPDDPSMYTWSLYVGTTTYFAYCEFDPTTTTGVTITAKRDDLRSKYIGTVSTTEMPDGTDANGDPVFTDVRKYDWSQLIDYYITYDSGTNTVSMHR